MLQRLVSVLCQSFSFPSSFGHFLIEVGHVGFILPSNALLHGGSAEGEGKKARSGNRWGRAC